MSVQHISCPRCQSKLKAPAATFGKTLKCPSCSNPIAVPISQPAVSEVALLREEIAQLRQQAGPAVVRVEGGEGRRRDRVFLDDADAFVSTTRIKLRGGTYATANVTSVRMSRSNHGKWRLVFWGLAMVASGVGLGAVVFYPLFAIAVVGLVLFVIGLLTRPTYYALIRTSGEETTALSTRDRAYCVEVLRAIDDAIEERG